MPKVELRDLVAADPFKLAAILSDPLVRKHMPLADGEVTSAWVVSWRKNKISQWPAGFDLGPWAVYVDDRLAGWGGLQPEPDSSAENPSDAGLAMVLAPEFWGVGIQATQLALSSFLERIKASNRQIERVFIDFPESRRAGRVLERFGFVLFAQADIAGVMFNRYELRLID